MTLRLLGVSIPRSGHHYLARLLRRALGPRLRYCRFYDLAGCCGRVPCQRLDAEILFQKNHDFQLDLPRDLPVRYLVQVRAPVASALSDRELYAETYGRDLAADAVDLLVWLAKSARYREGFAARWLEAPPAGAVLLRYEALTAAPEAALADLLTALGIAIEPAALAEAVAAEAAQGGFTGERPFALRSVEASAFFDAALFGQFEALLADSAPALVTQRTLPAALDEGHPFIRCHRALRLAAAGDLPGATALLEGLRRQLGEHPALLAEAAALRQAAGDLAAAAALVQQALAGRPTDPALVMQRVLLARALGDLEVAAAGARRLIELMPASPGHRVLLATILAEGGERAATLAALADALAAGPTEAVHWGLLAGVLIRCGEAAEARRLLDEAEARWPGHPDLAPLADWRG